MYQKHPTFRSKAALTVSKGGLLFSRSVVFDSLWPHELWYSRLPCPFTISWSLLKLMFIESVMPSNHLILCHPLLILPSILPRIRVFFNKLALCIRWPKYWSFKYWLFMFPYICSIIQYLYFYSGAPSGKDSPSLSWEHGKCLERKTSCVWGMNFLFAYPEMAGSSSGLSPGSANFMFYVQYHE